MGKFLKDVKADLYLHGHIHKSWSFKPFAELPLVSINSGGSCRYKEGYWSGIHRIHLNEKEIAVERLFIGKP